MTIAEGNWAKDPLRFLRTLKAVFAVADERIKHVRGRSMQELVARAAACQSDQIAILEPRPSEPLRQGVQTRSKTLQQQVVTSRLPLDDLAATLGAALPEPSAGV
jgi:hypothetical protein